MTDNSLLSVKWSIHAFGSSYRVFPRELWGWPHLQNFLLTLMLSRDLPFLRRFMISAQFYSFGYSPPFICHSTPPCTTFFALFPFTLKAQMSIPLPQNRSTFHISFSILEVLHSHHLECTEPTVSWSAPGKSGFFLHTMFSLWQCRCHCTQLWSSNTTDTQVFTWIKMNEHNMKSTLLFMQKHTCLSHISSSLMVSLMFKYHFSLQTVWESGH